MSLFTKLSRRFKHRTDMELNYLVKEYGKRFLDEGAIAVGHDGDGLVIYTHRDLPYLQSYGESKVKVVKLDEPFRAYSRTGEIRPLQGGISIGHRDIGAGTLSLIVCDRETSTPYLMSNNHVFANVNKAELGDPIYQPGIADASEHEINAKQVAKLEKYVKLENGVKVDVAVAKPTIDREQIASGVYGIYPEIRGEQEPLVNLPVQKSGRTTDTTYGTITAVGASVDVYYGTHLIRLEDCFIAKMTGAPGDSGSPITTQGSTKKLVGILFAGGSGHIIGCKWSNIKQSLNLELLEDVRPVVLDISKWNGRIIDVGKLKSNKVLAVYLKCTQGDYHKDERFGENWEILKNAGIKVGAYIYVDPSKSARSQFEYFCKEFGGRIPDLPVALDCEYTGNQTREKITSVIQELANLLSVWQREKFVGLKPPLIYTRASWWNAYVLPWSGWMQYGLWVARYGVDRPWVGISDKYKVRDWSDWLLWQYSADENNDGARYGLESRAVDKSIASEKFVCEYLGNDFQPEQPPQQAKYRGTVIVDTLNVRAEPSTSAQIIGRLRRNETVYITEVISDSKYNLWARLVIGGWSCARYNRQWYIDIPGYTENGGIKKGKVIVDALNIRNAPDITAQKIGVVSYGTILSIYDEVTKSRDEIWVKIGENSDEYCARRYNGKDYIAYL